MDYLSKGMIAFLLVLFSFIATASISVPDNTVRIHYNREDSKYTDWKLYPWGRELNLLKTVSLRNSLSPSGVDLYGIYFDVPMKESGVRFGFIIHKNGRKNSGEDLKYDLRKYGNEVWLLQQSSVIYSTQPKVDLATGTEKVLVNAKTQSSTESKPKVNIAKVSKPPQAEKKNKPAGKSSIQLEQEKLAQLLDKNSPKVVATVKSKAVSKKPVKAKTIKKVIPTVKENKVVKVTPVVKEKTTVKVAPVVKEKAVVKAKSEVVAERKPSVEFARQTASEAKVGLPSWIWLVVAFFSLVPVIVIVLYRKQMSAMAEADSNSSISKTLASALVKPENAINTSTEQTPNSIELEEPADVVKQALKPTISQENPLTTQPIKTNKPDNKLEKRSKHSKFKLGRSKKEQSKLEPSSQAQEKVSEKVKELHRVGAEATKAQPKNIPVKHSDIASKPVDAKNATSAKQEPSEKISKNRGLKAAMDNETGLPNKALFCRKFNVSVAKAKESQTKLAVILIDFDEFKSLNCELNEIRNDLFKALVTRFKQALGGSDILCRYEQSSFVITSEFKSDMKDITRFAQKLVIAGNNPLKVAGETITLDTNVGVSIYPTDGTEVNKLLDNAHQSVKRAKEKGGNRFQFTSEQTNVRSMQHLAFESSLRHAIDSDQLLMNYQPIVETQSQRIIGVEALVRWQHPDLGLISPAQFINVAEEAGLISDLGLWVLNSSCVQGAKWHQKDINLQLSVNISPNQLATDEFYTQLSKVLEDTGFPAEYLTLDIQETAILENSEHNLAILERVHQLGVQISIDNFGTGHSSLVQLKKFPIDQIKIDRSFIKSVQSNKDDAATTASIIAMARNLDIELVAEGVEFQAQRDYLIKHECELMQGALFCDAKPAAILTALLKQRFEPIERPIKKPQTANRFPQNDEGSDVDKPLEYDMGKNNVTRLPTKRA